MIEVQKTEPTHILEIKMIEKMSTADLEHVEPVFEKYISEHSAPRLLVIMEQFEGWENVTTVLKDLKFDKKYAGKFKRIAVAGDANWEGWMATIGGALISSKLKFFKLSDLEDARKWLRK